ncbi:MAG: BMP family ABC transporter substrate-binding protein [Chromatiales bacterium]|jgi:basic membrane protein A and related proteins|nr:BMP family ABC transporter substrate-binding protein [Chromatiales bacterium]
MGYLNRRDFLRSASALGLSAAAASLLSRTVLAGEVLKVGVIYVSPIADIGWTKQHNDAALAIKKTFGDKVELTVVDSLFKPQDIERVLVEMASAGHKLIFGTSFSHSTPIQKAAKRFPNVVFEHCSGLKHGKNLGTFEAKYYEGTYLAGMAAGAMTQSRKLGFIGGFPIPDIVGPANALLLGARSVSSDTTCQAIFLNSWYDPGKEKDAATALMSQGCDVICSMTDTATGVQTAEANGAWSVGYASDMSSFGPTKHLTAFTLDWSSVYVDSAKRVMAGDWSMQVRWQGLAEGVVKMSPYNAAIPAERVAQLKAVEAKIASGELHPYAGELKDQSGKVRVKAGSRLPDGDIRGFNWFVEGMIGNVG